MNAITKLGLAGIVAGGIAIGEIAKEGIESGVFRAGLEGKSVTYCQPTNGDMKIPVLPQYQLRSCDHLETDIKITGYATTIVLPLLFLFAAGAPISAYKNSQAKK